MLALLTDLNLMPFHLSLVLLVILSMTESLGLYFKHPPSQSLRKLVPAHLQHLQQLNLKFPKFLLLIFLLLNFACAGYILQFALHTQHGYFPAAYYVLLPAFIVALFLTTFMSHCLNQILPAPQDSPQNSDLLGHLATISSNNAKPSFAAQARVRNQFGHLHYVPVEPEFGELEIHTAVILIRMKRNHYIGKKVAPSNSLFQNQSPRSTD